MSTAYIGEIRMFAGNFPPAGWQFCNGQLLAISQYAALFSILGTQYGGNGTTNFALPNLQGRVPIHAGTGLSTYVQGQEGGVENVTLLYNQMPIHNHQVNAVATGGNSATPTGSLPAIESTGTSLDYSSSAGNTTMNPAMVGTAGGNAPFSVLQPYLAVSFIIALEGIFPSRN